MLAGVFVISCLALPAFSSPLPVAGGGPVVDLDYSQYLGTQLSNGVNQFLGMRYAAPPLADLRFRAPVEPLVTAGVQTAQAFQPICLSSRPSNNSPRQAEDCLFINVWAPSSATPSSKLPVWFYIQGGGYVSNSNANYNGSTVVANSGHNIVFVNFNYRVGPFGFLSSERVRDNGDLNVGLLDERFALQWLQKNIAKFGGDPKHVVIHGASAGAGSVALHLSAYGGRDDGLFVGGIGESVFFPTQPQVSELEWQFDRLANNVGCAGSSDEVDCLRAKDAATLQNASLATPYPGQAGSPNFYWTPSIDGDFIQDYPYFLYDQGSFVKVPIIFGDDTDEGTSFAANASTPAQVATFMKNNYPHLTSADADAINEQYPLLPLRPMHAPYFPSAAAAYGEATFTCPGNFISHSLARYNDPYKVWNYHYDVHQANNDAAGLGVPHTFETEAIFGPGNTNTAATAADSYTTYNKNIVPVVMDYWISFVRDLSPNRYKYKGAPHWESFGDGKNGGRRVLFQTNETRMEVIPQDQSERCAFWRTLAVKMEQ